jgi:regulatory protein
VNHPVFLAFFCILLFSNFRGMDSKFSREEKKAEQPEAGQDPIKMALQKMKQYCSYRERCHNEVKEKLYSLRIWEKYYDEIIATLIEENYLNEERFAILFAGGKFRMKQWGRIKIKSELKKRNVSDYCINKALKRIDEKEYLQTLDKLAAKKYSSLKGGLEFIRKEKTMDYLIGKGFEGELARAVMK